MLGGALGTLRFVARQQGLDMLGFETAEGLFGEATRADVLSADEALSHAQAEFRSALDLLGSSADDWTELEQWGFAESIADGIFDLFALCKARRNIKATEQVHEKVRVLFDKVVRSGSGLHDTQPLADWDDEGFRGEMKAQWHFNRSLFSFRAAQIVVFAVVVLSAVFGLIQHLFE